MPAGAFKTQRQVVQEIQTEIATGEREYRRQVLDEGPDFVPPDK